MTKKEYTKPMVKPIKWDFNTAICNTVYMASPCIKVIDETGGTTRIDHRYSTAAGGIEWNNWPGTGN